MAVFAPFLGRRTERRSGQFLENFFFCAAELLILTLLLHISEISTVNTVLPDELTGRLIVRDHIADIFVFLGCTVSSLPLSRLRTPAVDVTILQ